jgi:hypothetical protein
MRTYTARPKQELRCGEVIYSLNKTDIYFQILKTLIFLVVYNFLSCDTVIPSRMMPTYRGEYNISTFRINSEDRARMFLCRVGVNL